MNDPSDSNPPSSFRPWNRRDGDARDSFERPRSGGQPGGYRSDTVWRSEAAQKASGGGERKPWQQRDDRRDDRGGGGFERKPWQHRDDRRDDRGGGGFERKPWQQRDDRRDDRGGGGFERKPWQQRADRGGFDRGPRPEQTGPSEPPKRRFPAPPSGELIYGRQPVREVLRAARRGVLELIIADGVKPNDDMAAIETIAQERSISIRRFDRDTLDAWLNAANHQGVIAVCQEFAYTEFDDILETMRTAEGDALVVLLDHVVDPQNLGSLLRSCEAAGVVGVVLPADRAVGVTPAAVRASAGAAEHLRVAIVPNLVGAMEKFKEIPVWATGLESVPEAQPYTAIDYKGKVALVVGSEGQGLGRLVREHCDHLARLPMFGQVGSLNAGVAGALAMYEVLRQQGRTPLFGGDNDPATGTSQASTDDPATGDTDGAEIAGELREDTPA